MLPCNTEGLLGLRAAAALVIGFSTPQLPLPACSCLLRRLAYILWVHPFPCNNTWHTADPPPLLLCRLWAGRCGMPVSACIQEAGWR